MRSLSLVTLSVLICILSIISCEKKKKDEITSEVVEKVESVCILDGQSLRLEAKAQAKWLNSMSLGESVYWLGQTRIDSTDKNKKYIKIMLSDGTEGWALDWGIVINAKVGAIKEEAPIYKRPDMLTITNKTFEFMDMVAISTEKSDWLEVTGERRSKSGWIKKDRVTTEKTDVTSAILAAKQLNNKKSIVSVIESSPYPQSYFIQKLREQTGQEGIEEVKTEALEGQPDSSESVE